jgi:hypothetical protein
MHQIYMNYFCKYANRAILGYQKLAGVVWQPQGPQRRIGGLKKPRCARVLRAPPYRTSRRPGQQFLHVA